MASSAGLAMPIGTSQFSLLPFDVKLAGKSTTTSSLPCSASQCAFESVATACM